MWKQESVPFFLPTTYLDLLRKVYLGLPHLAHQPDGVNNRLLPQRQAIDLNKCYQFCLKINDSKFIQWWEGDPLVPSMGQLTSNDQNCIIVWGPHK